MMKSRLSLFFAVILLLIANIASAQCMLEPVSLSQRVNQSAYIAQGRVTEQHCYIDAKSGSVNTLNTVEVNAWLKNDPGTSTVYLITEGGVLGNRATIVNPSLQVNRGMEYVFFLRGDDDKKGDVAFRSQHPDALQLMAYSDGQGAMSYLKDGYHDMFGMKPVSEEMLFSKIAGLCGQSPSFIPGRKRGFEINTELPSPHCPIPTGILFYPTVSNAGTTDTADFITEIYECTPVLGFTSTDPLNPIVTLFTMPSDYYYNSSGDYIVKIPELAGTGPTWWFVGYNDPITINYSHESVYSNFSGFSDITRQRYYLRNMNGNGGYTYTLNSTFAANTTAVAAFSRAASNWRCFSGVNIEVSGTTAVSTVAADGISVVMFDNSLPAGELARTTKQLSSAATAGCNLSNTIWYQTESDFQFKQAGISWQYGPGLPGASEYDFESVSLHEIGHAIGLAHTNNNTDVMFHLNAAGAYKRQPYTNDLNGIAAKMAYSTVPGCFSPAGSGTPMVAAVCAPLPLPVSISNLSGVRLDKTSNQLYWTTYQEANNRGFAIQRSSNGQNFHTIDFVNGAINSTVSHNYVYKDIQAGESPWYYRLLITGTDGSTKASSVAFVPGYKNSDWKVWLVSRQSGIVVYRNPAVKEEADFQLFNSNGQLLGAQHINAANTAIPVEQYPNGVYYYRLVTETATLSGKIIIN